MAILDHPAAGTAPMLQNNMGTLPDWVSAICSLIATVVALLTLITVYLASIQILTRRQIYRLGLSKKSLGPWKSTVVSPSAIRMQTQIKTPTLSVPLLVQKKWKPEIAFPVGFELSPKKAHADLEAGTQVHVLAEASWVNFLQGLGLNPENGKSFYKMQYESELVNGIVPMRWKGRDLVGICSILGFQSIESDPSTRKPMQLPTRWSGPLGWLQFRASSDGCIVEYRRRAVIKDQLHEESHDYYRKLNVECRPFKLKSRLWQSISGMCLSDNEYFTDEELKGKLFGRKANRPQGLRPEDFEKGMSQASSQHTRGISDLLGFLDSDFEKKASEGNSKKRMAVLYLSPGHLSVAIEGELVHSRGLGQDTTYEHSYIYTDEDEVDKEYEFKLGCLRMNRDLLAYMKEAVLRIEPDGFYFSSSKLLNFQVAQIWSHASSISEKRLDKKYIFPTDRLAAWAESEPSKQLRDDSPEKQLCSAIKLINNFQLIKSTSRAMFTTADMVLISKASVSLRDLIKDTGMDLVWAILASPKVFDHLTKCITETTMEDLLASKLSCSSGFFNFEKMKCSAELDMGLSEEKIRVELVGNRTFEGIQVVATVMDVFLNFS
ncbi:hypothetical protein L873DRAFT_1862036 [Choiromyces venosus 120613-1]|uniref:Uncharacterized protein n=1 Tax=Choiromyces venosus 120613-1 TaxID=1336337 RepID=A0A3N4J598_9PEZI|nr:hypothetical protein L873DRAFT_1862036 [Choiromyces venosus 120613-1]